MTATEKALPTDGGGGAGEVLFDATGVRKSFGGVHALRGAHITVRSGEIHALIGENGAGKSTLIKVLTGVYEPDAGELRFLGEDVQFASPAAAQDAGVATVYQEVNLVPVLSVARNIYLGREPRTRWGTVDIKAMHRKARELVRRLGIDVDVTGELGRLGLGVQQMVALARAVSVDARVVIMDEPTSSLEPREVETLFGVARNLRDQGVGIVFVSHRLDELFALCDALTIMRDGEVVHTGRIEDIDRSGLVSLMLGRTIDDVVGSSTGFTRESHVVEGEPVLSVRGLEARHRVHDVDLDVHRGEIVGLGGLLGSGRSETVKAVYGALQTEGGTVSVDGKQLRRGDVPRSLRSGIALLSEDRKAEGVVPDLSVRDNIALAVLSRVSRFGVVSDKKMDDLVDVFMKRLKIKASSPHQKVRELSGGNQQKVLLARWLCTEPTVFLLDEPTRGIDVGAKREVQALIGELAERGLGVVMISSEVEELMEGTDRVVVLHDGGVSEVLSGQDITNARLLAAMAGDEYTEEDVVAVLGLTDEDTTPQGATDAPQGAADMPQGATDMPQGATDEEER